MQMIAIRNSQSQGGAGGPEAPGARRLPDFFGDSCEDLFSIVARLLEVMNRIAER